MVAIPYGFALLSIARALDLAINRLPTDRYGNISFGSSVAQVSPTAAVKVYYSKYWKSKIVVLANGSKFIAKLGRFMRSGEY